MIQVKKENRVLTVDERSLDSYLKQGYDHVEIDPATMSYKIVKPGRGKTIPYEIHFKLQQDFEALKAELEKLKVEVSKAPKK